MCGINYEDGISNIGNKDKLIRLFEKARAGETLTIGMIGGSITQGCLSSVPEKCYAYRVFSWWQTTFPRARFKYVNAGIGGTTSHFGAARVHKDLLDYKPDFVIVEFSVNDESNPFFEETYEGLIRQILKDDNDPFLMVVHSVFYTDGKNAQVYHSKVVRHYDLMSVSMQSSLYPLIVSGRLNIEDISSDGLHPNDYGHEIMSKMICYALDKVRMEGAAAGKAEGMLREALTENHYENSHCIKNDSKEVTLQGFAVMTEPQDRITDCFRNGWRSKQEGAKLTLTVNAGEIAVQYRQTILGPAPRARVIVDNDEKSAVILDANFDEDWGDNLALTPVMIHGEHTLHTVEIEIIDVPKISEYFEVISIICA